MSVRLMSAIWDMKFTPVEKLVLLALADWANDDGQAWPSITQLADKTGCGERTIQRTLRAAEERGLLKREEVIGKGCRYVINPRHCDTPARQTPVPDRRESPASVAPNTLEHSNTLSDATHPQETRAPAEKPKKKKADPFPCPDGVDPLDWDGLKANRKAARAPMTAGAYRQIVNKLDGWNRDGWPPGPIVAHAVERGWRTVFETDEMKGNGNGGRHNTGMDDGGDPLLADLARARREAEAEGACQGP